MTPPGNADDNPGPPSLDYDPHTQTFTQPETPDGGWQAFADLLKKAEPSVNTAIPLTPSQVSAHVAALIDSGRAQEALDVIAKQQAAHDAISMPGTDVQLRYQQGRALAALDRHDEATAIWQQMTTDYPELPEPWNALAIEYARQGQLQRARDALDMALVSDPKFKPALENLGYVQMRLAQQSFERAGIPVPASLQPAPKAAAPANPTPPATENATSQTDPTAPASSDAPTDDKPAAAGAQ